MQRDLDVGVEIDAELARTADRSQLRETLRRWELRDPLRRIEPLLGDDGGPADAAPQALAAELT